MAAAGLMHRDRARGEDGGGPGSLDPDTLVTVDGDDVIETIDGQDIETIDE
jgi:hypothetical protein